MESKLLPDQISSYREIVFNNLAFVDKTMFIQKLEDKHIKVPLFLRPRRFGKTLFTDILSEYYDVDNACYFEKLFGNTYIGKNPTATRNSYYILRFDFSGIDYSHLEINFFETVKNQLKIFCSKYSSLNLTVNENSVSPASILEDLVTSFIEKRPHKTDQIFVIIDEYDNFANDVLATDVEHFKSMTSAEGFVKNFYARLNALSGSSLSAIGRFFITGVSSIMINSVTSGFNSENISQHPDFNEMVGFTEEELRDLIRQTLDLNSYKGLFTEDDLVDRMKQHFDGYSFAEICKHHIFNSSMCINYLGRVESLGRLTNNYSDANVNLDTDKLSRLMSLIRKNERENLIKIVAHADERQDCIYSTLEENLNINAETEFSFEQGVSMLFYLGYLTYGLSENGRTIFRVPNLEFKKLFMKYYMSVFFMKGSLSGRFNNMSDLEETGDMSVFTECLREVITGIIPDNEKDVTERAIVSIAGTLILGNLEYCRTETEYEIWHNGCKTDKRADLVILNKDRNKPSFLIEFKYIREKAVHSESTRKRNISKVKRTAREQLAEYMTDDRLKEIPNLHKYIIVYAYGELFFEKLKEKQLMSQHKSQTAIKQFLHAHSVQVQTQLMQTFMNIQAKYSKR